MTRTNEAQKLSAGEWIAIRDVLTDRLILATNMPPTIAARGAEAMLKEGLVDIQAVVESAVKRGLPALEAVAAAMGMPLTPKEES